MLKLVKRTIVSFNDLFVTEWVFKGAKKGEKSDFGTYIGGVTVTVFLYSLNRFINVEVMML